jgi:hypothetical protein
MTIDVIIELHVTRHEFQALLYVTMVICTYVIIHLPESLFSFVSATSEAQGAA